MECQANTPEDMNTCCNSLVDKIGKLMRRGELTCGVMENETVVKPALLLWESGGVVSVALFLGRLVILVLMEILRGLNGGCTEWSGSYASRALGVPYNGLHYMDRTLLHRQFKIRYSEVEHQTSTKPVVAMLTRINEIALFTRETAMLWWGLAATSVCSRLPAINFEEEKLTRLGEWFSQTIGGPSKVFSRLSNIYSGRAEQPK